MEQQELLADGVPAEKIVVRYNGIEGKTFGPVNARGNFRKKWSIGSTEPILLFLGRLIPRKGADILIDAFAEACPDSGRLVIAGPEGEPGYQKVLSKRAREAGVESRVIFAGAVYDDEKAAVLADSDIFVLPSKYENFANSVAEAMACGIPVIITDACGIRSLVEGRAGLVISPEREALTAAIATLISDRTTYQRFQAGCRAAAAELGWERLSEQMEGYYSKVLGSRNGSH
jgi:glycosyltransferase involved in cell wall biosynthesis